MAGGSAQPSTLGAAAKALTFPRTRAAVWALAVRRQPVESRTLRVILWWGASFFVLAVYGLLREFMDDFGMPRHGGGWEEAVFGGLPTVWLQDHLWTLAPKPLEWASVLVHSSWFFVPPIAGLFVSFRRPDRIGSFFRWWMALELLALPLWAIFPVRPPWMDNGEVTRIIAIRFGGHIDDPNPFAALPSLHVAFPLMISLWFFRERWLRPALLMLAYTSLISFEVVFSGEHYVMDVAGAAVVAGVVALAASPQAAFNSISRLASGLRDAVRARWPKPRLETATKPERGQALMELALVLPVVVLFILVLVDFGIAIDRREVLQHAVREGSREGVVAAQYNGSQGSCGASDVLCSIKKFTVEESQGLLTDADVTACVVNTNGDAVNGNTGDNLRVSATFTYKFSVGGGEVLTAFGAGVPSIDMTPTADLRLEKTVAGISTC